MTVLTEGSVYPMKLTVIKIVINAAVKNNQGNIPTPTPHIHKILSAR